MSQKAEEVLLCPSCLKSFVTEGDIFGAGSQDIESQTSKDGEICWSVVLAAPDLIFAEQDVELPMQIVFDGPVASDRNQQFFCRHFAGQRKTTDFVSGLAVDGAPAFEPADSAQIDECVLAGRLGEGDD